jgi:hypothetical protein
MVRLVQLQFVMPTMSPAREVDASATRANRISQDRDKERNSRSDDLRHLERCECGLEFSNVMVCIISLSFCPVAYSGNLFIAEFEDYFYWVHYGFSIG